MSKLNLTTKTDSQKIVKEYLEQNVSDTLAEKINNGVIIEKDGKRLINRKNLDGFMKYACGEARKQAAKGQNSACIPDSEVFGWAMHYFEEDSIEGTLFNEDGTEYKPHTAVKKPAETTVIPPKPQPKPQLSLFDMLTEKQEKEPSEPVTEHEKPITKPEPELQHEKTSALLPDEPPTQEEMNEAFEELAKSNSEETAKPAGNPIYQKYSALQKNHPDCVIAYRLGDFYEIFGDNAAIISEELDLTLTGRDLGLSERVPMIGFPYHAADTYFNKLVNTGKKIAVCDNENHLRFLPDIDTETGEILNKQQENTLLSAVSELLGDVFIFRR